MTRLLKKKKRKEKASNNTEEMMVCARSGHIHSSKRFMACEKCAAGMNPKSLK